MAHEKLHQKSVPLYRCIKPQQGATCWKEIDIFVTLLQAIFKWISSTCCGLFYNDVGLNEHIWWTLAYWVQHWLICRYLKHKPNNTNLICMRLSRNGSYMWFFISKYSTIDIVSQGFAKMYENAWRTCWLPSVCLCVCFHISTDLIMSKCPYESLCVIFTVVIIFIQWGETSVSEQQGH